MIFQEETRIMSSTNDEVEVEETLNAETLSMEESNMTRAKVEVVREENERLKLTLSQMLKDYHSLKMQFDGIATHQEDHQSKKASNLASMAAASDDGDESELVSLSLGRFSGEEKKINGCNATQTLKIGTKLDVGIQLGLNCKLNSDNSAVEVSRNLTSAENSVDESKEEVRSSPKNSRIGDDEILQHNPLKKPRVSVRALCNSQTMHDGCQWRKYGQKVAKGNPCPRAYYRCTVSLSCPVRKQVQRCIDDMSILVTTYEGTHDHPLPPSAVAMASVTSSAVAMVSCGSSTSSSPPRHGAISAAAANPSSLFGYNFGSHNYHRATISSSQSHPTVILDLTAPNHTQKFSPSTLFSAATHSSSPSPSLNFSSNFDHIKFPIMNSAAALFSGIQTPAANDLKIAAATKAITHDPNFRSALAAAITSFVGNNNNNSNVGGRNSGMDFHLNFAQPSTNNASIGCAASFMDRFPQ